MGSTNSSEMISTFERRSLDFIFNTLMKSYAERVPELDLINTKLIDAGVVDNASEIENDHVAFRTMGVPNLGIESLEKIFLHYGYERRDHYSFEEKGLDACWYAPPSPGFPRVFISELRVQDLHRDIQSIIRKYTDSVVSDPVDEIDLNDAESVGGFFHQALWPVPNLVDHRKLASVNEYAAWVIFNRHYLNHYTFSVHNFEKGFNTIAAFNSFLLKNGVALNDSGGMIKESADGLLIQSSTVANLIEVEFACGSKAKVSGSYVEFIERRVLPEFECLPQDSITRAHRRDGFETGNADKIFESTYEVQTSRRA